MHKEKILLVIVTKDGSSLALQVSYLKLLWEVFSLYSLRPFIYIIHNPKKLAIVVLVQ